ncbi:MAG: sulfotransferase [Pseudomonadales bacterium]
MSGLPSASDYHRTPIRVFNALIRGLNKIGVANFPLEVSSVLASARKQTGLQEFGDDSFLPKLDLLINALNSEADLNPLGRLMQRQSITSILRDRLYLHDLLSKHPEILERKIPSPVVIVGLARSGTTRLHRLMASDSQFLHVKAWESMNPVPYPDSLKVRDSGEGIDPRITEIEQGLKVVLYMSPQIAAVHPLGAHEVEEEIGMIMHDFSTQMFEVQAKIESFAEHLMTNDQTHAYQHMRTLMQVISWFRKDPEDKPWIMKSPQHMQDLDALLATFPDAKLICPHRDPVKVVGSSCSMTWNSIVRDSDSIDPHWVGQEWLAKTQRMLVKNLSIRDGLPAAQQHDVLYADITADWEASLQGIYDFLGMEFSGTAKQGMRDWLASNAQHKHGAHKYSLEDFGISKEQVEEKLQFYRQRFNIPFETKNPHIK